MSRIRTIKPEFWSDEKLAPLSPTTRLVFLGLISMADDRGRMLDNPKQLDAFIFPQTSETTAASIADLAANGRIVRGITASGQRIIEIVNWRHQKIDRPNYPACLPAIKVLSVQESEPIRRSLDESSTMNRRSLDDDASNHINDLLSPINDLLSTTSAVSDETGSMLEFPKPKKQKLDYSSEFETAWSQYPHPPGDSKHDAAKAFAARRNDGHTPEVIQAGVVAYRAYCEAEGILKSKYCKQGATFFGPGLHFLSDWSFSTSANHAHRSYNQMSPDEKKAQMEQEMAKAAQQVLARQQAIQARLTA